jgi:S1-C subfamily serine protease
MFASSDSARRASASVFIVIFALGLLIGGLGSYYINSRQITVLNNRVDDLQNQINTNQAVTIYQNQTVSNQTVTVYQNQTSLTDLYSKVANSVVLIQGTTNDSDVQASGFVYNYSGQMVVLTNFHVVQDTTKLSVTFSDGNGYAATVLGSDPYADLAVITVDAPATEFVPLQIVSSSSLQVGEQVIAIGNPYGLVCSLTTGVVSALGRSETADFTANFTIANMIQTSTPINPGNSGGPLLNELGNVVGITNSVVSDSQGVGFAVPSNTILRELPSLISTGTYRDHSYLGIHVTDMSYDLAQEEHINVTYGVWIPSGTGQTMIDPSGPSANALREGDVIIALNGTKVRNNDDMASYLEEHTVPNDLLIITVVRNNSTLTENLTLGVRPQLNL